MRIKPHQPGISMYCWKEAESKIDEVHHSQARTVLLNCIAEMETMGLLISKKSVNLTVKFVKKPVKKYRKVDQNCMHVRPHREHYLCKFQMKLSHNVALGMVDQEQPLVNYDTVHLQLSCWLVDLFIFDLA